MEIPPSTETRKVTIALVDIRIDRARIGISAPREISVDRKEVADARERGEQRHAG